MIGRLKSRKREKSTRIFNSSPQSIDTLFRRQRRRIADKFGNPRLLQIHFHTLRHLHATMLYHRKKDILLVKSRLGHKRIDNTLLYTQLVNFENDQYHSATAQTVEEAKKLVEASFEYVCGFNEIKVFRKRK